MGNRRVPALAFAAAFLVSFNVFSAFHDDVPASRLARADELTRTTASRLVPSRADRDADPRLGVATRAAGASDAERPRRRDADAKPDDPGRGVGGAAGGATAASNAAATTRRRADPDDVDDDDARRPAARKDDDASAAAAAASVVASRQNPTPDDTKPSNPKTTKTDPRDLFDPQEHTEYGGDVVKWGQTFLVDSARACHDACVAHAGDLPAGCNVWVFCPNPSGCGSEYGPHRACWLKHQPRPDNPVGPSDATNPWTSGTLAARADTRGERGAHKRFHVVVTTNANVYQAWQVRVMYYWFLKQKAAQDPETGQMGGFTRVLHDRPDALVDEIPTCVVDRLDNEYGFVVLSRPNAFRQFFEKCPEIEEDYVLMAEPDHLYLRPLDNLMSDARTPAAFPFFYINPKNYPKLVRRFAGETLTDAEIEAMDPIGSSPVFLHKDDLRKIAPIWHDVTLKIKQDPEADKEWGWVLEMYGYTIAAKIAGLRHDLRPKLAAQPPWDKSIGDFYILHFTYGNDYDLDGKFTPGKIGKWRFDKRAWMSSIPPKNLEPPPEGCDNELVKRLVEMVNEASAALPNWEDPLGNKRRNGEAGGGRGMLSDGAR